MTKFQSKIVIVFSLVFIAALSRLIPHPPNFNPLMSIALFGGVMFSRQVWAFAIPFIALVLSDLIIGFYGIMMLPVYLSLALVVLHGFWVNRKSKEAGKFAWGSLGISVLSSSLVFFVTTNFFVWLLTPMYAKTFVGLMECFTLAIPFFDNTVFSNVVYSVAIFGSYELLKAARPHWLGEAI